MLRLKLNHVSKRGHWWHLTITWTNLDSRPKIWASSQEVFMTYSTSQEICTRFFALLCFVVVIHWLIFPYPSGLLHWHCVNLTIAPVPAKQPWWIWINTACEYIMNDCITTTKQSTTKPCAYFLGYTVIVTRVRRLHFRVKYPTTRAEPKWK